MNFFGKNGYFVELPKAEEINDWDKYTSINYLLDPNKEEEIEEEQDTMIHNFNFTL